MIIPSIHQISKYFSCPFLAITHRRRFYGKKYLATTMETLSIKKCGKINWSVLSLSRKIGSYSRLWGLSTTFISLCITCRLHLLSIPIPHAYKQSIKSTRNYTITLQSKSSYNYCYKFIQMWKAHISIGSLNHQTQNIIDIIMRERKMTIYSLRVISMRVAIQMLLKWYKKYLDLSIQTAKSSREASWTISPIYWCQSGNSACSWSPVGFLHIF